VSRTARTAPGLWSGGSSGTGPPRSAPQTRGGRAGTRPCSRLSHSSPWHLPSRSAGPGKLSWGLLGPLKVPSDQSQLGKALDGSWIKTCLDTGPCVGYPWETPPETDGSVPHGEFSAEAAPRGGSGGPHRLTSPFYRWEAEGCSPSLPAAGVLPHLRGRARSHALRLSPPPSPLQTSPSSSSSSSHPGNNRPRLQACAFPAAALPFPPPCFELPSARKNVIAV